MISLGKYAKIGLGWSVINTHVFQVIYCVKIIYYSILFYSRTFLTFGSIYAFVLSRRSIDKRRYEDMKIRERIRNSNIGEYESTRKFT